MMNATTLYVVVGLLAILIIYIVAGMIWDHRQDIKDIMAVRRHYHKKDALLIDYYRMDGALALYPDRNWMDDTVRWMAKGQDIEEPYEEAYRMGYDRAEKWMSQLRYIGIPIFVRLHNFTIIDPRTMDESLGKRNRVTSGVMYNVFKRRAAKRFMANIMSKVKFAEMDVKTLGILIPVVIGLVIGVAYFMTGGM